LGLTHTCLAGDPLKTSVKWLNEWLAGEVKCMHEWMNDLTVEPWS
jgi:hypothetical protein